MKDKFQEKSGNVVFYSTFYLAQLSRAVHSCEITVKTLQKEADRIAYNKVIVSSFDPDSFTDMPDVLIENFTKAYTELLQCPPASLRIEKLEEVNKILNLYRQKLEEFAQSSGDGAIAKEGMHLINKIDGMKELIKTFKAEAKTPFKFEVHALDY